MIIFPSVQCTNAEIQIHNFINTHILHKNIGSIHPIQIYASGNICQLNFYIGIGYILSTIWEYISIGGCPTLRAWGFPNRECAFSRIFY